MYDTKMFGQFTDYQKTLIDNSFTMMTAIQDQGFSMMDKAIEKNTLLPDSSRKFCADWINTIKQNRDNYRSYIESGIGKLDTFFTEAQTKVSPEKTPAKKKQTA